jgi:hypothetical protein
MRILDIESELNKPIHGAYGTKNKMMKYTKDLINTILNAYGVENIVVEVDKGSIHIVTPEVNRTYGSNILISIHPRTKEIHGITVVMGFDITSEWTKDPTSTLKQIEYICFSRYFDVFRERKDNLVASITSLTKSLLDTSLDLKTAFTEFYTAVSWIHFSTHNERFSAFEEYRNKLVSEEE